MTMDGLVKVVERCVGVYFYVATEVFYFVR